MTEAYGLSEKQNPDASPKITYAEALSEIEGILIQVLEPRLNRQGPKWQQTAAEFVQSGIDSINKIGFLTEQVAELQAMIAKLQRS